MVLVDKILPKLRTEGHRVLIFSQFIRVPGPLVTPSPARPPAFRRPIDRARFEQARSTHSSRSDRAALARFRRQVLDILEDYMRWKGFPVERIDGRIRGSTRQVRPAWAGALLQGAALRP